jgi:hypothetical protein
LQIQGKDGEIRIYSNGEKAIAADDSSTTYYFSVLFCEMDFTGPISRPRTEERMILNRGNYDTNSHFAEGPDDVRIAPIPISFSCRLADTVNTRILSDILASSTSRITNTAGGASNFPTWDGDSAVTIDSIAVPAFYDSTKRTYRVEVLWDTSGSDHGYRYENAYLTFGEQGVAESADGVMLNCSGMVYGDVTRITSFYSGTSILAFS